MAVERHRLGTRQQRVFGVQMLPACLHHADTGIRDEIRNSFEEEILPRDEVGIENGDELTAGKLQAFPECSRLETLPVLAPELLDVESLLPELFHVRCDHLHGAVRRIVQQLDLQLVLRVVDRRDALE